MSDVKLALLALLKIIESLHNVLAVNKHPSWVEAIWEDINDTRNLINTGDI